MHVSAIDAGGYSGTGIVLYADDRWGRPGAKEISNNKILQNDISLTSDNPAVVDVNAIEITDTRDNPNATPVIFDNAVGFNDLRSTATPIVLTPENLGEYNAISRNLGDSRGHGVQPKLLFD